MFTCSWREGIYQILFKFKLFKVFFGWCLLKCHIECIDRLAIQSVDAGSFPDLQDLGVWLNTLILCWFAAFTLEMLPKEPVAAGGCCTSCFLFILVIFLLVDDVVVGGGVTNHSVFCNSGHLCLILCICLECSRGRAFSTREELKPPRCSVFWPFPNWLLVLKFNLNRRPPSIDSFNDLVEMWNACGDLLWLIPDNVPRKQFCSMVTNHTAFSSRIVLDFCGHQFEL